MSDWYSSQPYNRGEPGSNVISGGAGSLAFRDPLDAARSAAGVAPGSSYPDGYLGTIINRREDKLLGAVNKRLNDRSYQRGVHKGEKIDQSDYYWPTHGSVRPSAGLEAQARGRRVGNVIQTPRWAPSGNVVEKLAHMGKVELTPADKQAAYARYGVNSNMNDIIYDPERKERMKKYLPGWR